MIVDCLRVRRHIQQRFDRGEGGLTDRDALHLESCARCGELLRGYSAFSRELRRQAVAEENRAPAPSWETVLTAARSQSPGAERTDSGPAALLPARSVPRRAAGTGPGAPRAGKVGRRPGSVSRRLASRTSTVWTRAALLAVILGLGVFLGYREHRAAAARSFVRSSTTEFVNTIFSSSIFSASPDAAITQGIALDAAWFDATSETDELPLLPVPAGGEGPAASPQP